MTRLSLALFVILVSAPAFASSSQAAHAVSDSSHSHRYWLSQDFQKLVFWQPNNDTSAARR